MRFEGALLVKGIVLGFSIAAPVARLARGASGAL